MSTKEIVGMVLGFFLVPAFAFAFVFVATLAGLLKANFSTEAITQGLLIFIAVAVIAGVIWSRVSP